MKKIGYATGIFDFFHYGHQNFLKKCHENCDILIIAVFTDKFSETYKILPTQHENDRLESIKESKLCDRVLLSNGNDHEDYFQKFKITHLFHGSDWSEDKYIDFIGRDMVRKYQIKFIIIDYTEGISSTILRQNLKYKKKE